ncbi:hypothetical protein [Streptomyces gobitricini]|uniref:Uncharacterized protein n=1 Tax=Streptomyces gobitricini TaxID=68211 RepID=A0ABP5Z9W1_9ACTN
MEVAQHRAKAGPGASGHHGDLAGSRRHRPALVAAHHLLDRHGDPLLDLIALCVLAGVLSACARIAAAPGTAPACWTFSSLFAVPPVGQFSWSGHHDLIRLGCLLLAAGVSTMGTRLLHARAAYRRISPLA